VVGRSNIRPGHHESDAVRQPIKNKEKHPHFKKICFITGASRGFGRICAEAALKRGDKVAATARNLAELSDLADRFGESVLPLTLDVTDPKQARDVVAQAHAHFGNLDVSATSGIVKNRQITAEIYPKIIRENFGL
jgi:NADP-dependent 3-hydroxy acid dehydrogenase YdfG